MIHLLQRKSDITVPENPNHQVSITSKIAMNCGKFLRGGFYLINPVYTNGIFLYPLKTSKDPWFFDVFVDIEKEPWHGIG